MSQASRRQCIPPLSGEGDSARPPAEPQNSQHESDLDETETETDGGSSGDEVDENEQGLMPGNKQSVSFPRLSISKISINEKDKDKTAKEIISNIIRQAKERKRKHEGETPREKSRGTEGPAYQQSVPEATLEKLALRKCVNDRLEEHESCFHVMLFECTTPIQCQMSPAIESIIEPRHLQRVNQRKSYMIFFYRDMDGPEIFVAVSGMAYLHVDQRSCPEFPKKIARRLLEPATIQLDIRNVTGDTSQVRKQYIPEKGGTFGIWDVIDVVVHKYTAKPKEKSSILGVCNTWKTKRPSIAIKQHSVMVMTRFPNIYVMQKIISHFATIDRNKPTYQLVSSQAVEEDDKTFAMFDLMQEEHQRDTIKKLQNNFCDRISRYLRGNSEDSIQLSSDNLDLWLNASEYRLFLDTKSKRLPIKTWNVSPNFRDVIQALRENVEEISGQMLHTDVKMSLRIAGGKLCTKKPITSFIQSNFASSLLTPYYFWCGKWLKIKLEYFQTLNDIYMSIMEEQTISSAHVNLLPWVYSKAGKSSVKLTTEKFSLDSLHEFLTNFPNREVVVDLKETEQLLRSVGEVEEVGGSIACSYKARDYEHDADRLKLCLQIFLRMCTPLTEGMYNDTYILLDELITLTGNPLETGFIVGDRMLVNNIEMFDIIMYNQTHTYITHVKEGFDNNIRVVASQIRNSAEILFRTLTSHMTKSILDEMWDCFTTGRTKKEGMEKNQCAMKSKLSKLTKEGFMRLFKEREIVYVLAVRDKSADRTMKTAGALVTQLQSEHPSEYQEILQRLEAKGYVQKKQTDHVITENFIYVNQENFFKNMMEARLDKCNKSGEKGKIHDSDSMNSTAASSTELPSSTYNLTRGFDKQRPDSSSSAGSPQKSLTVTEDASPRPPARHENQGLGKDLWKKVYAILKDQLPDTRSSIVKLDLLSLFSHFRKYQIGEKKFQLKVCFIPKSTGDLRTFLGLKSEDVAEDKFQVTPKNLDTE